uniref:hypothetical protein n=1 Tax=Streptomyces sp. SS7 TaxID=3108485 RepID=UPI0040403067
MDLNTVTEVVRRPSEWPGVHWREGDAWLAGGTWLYSVEQPDPRRLIDLTALRWDPLVPTAEGLEIGATCTTVTCTPSRGPRTGPSDALPGEGDGKEAPPPSETRTSLAVGVGLYPTVVLLTLALFPLHLPLWIGLLVGNLLSSFLMSFPTMPYYVSPLLGRWLRPPRDEPPVRGTRYVSGPCPDGRPVRQTGSGRPGQPGR